jgi:hypothetical protein
MQQGEAYAVEAEAVRITACRPMWKDRACIKRAHCRINTPRPIRITGDSMLDHSQGRVTMHHKMHQEALPVRNRQAHFTRGRRKCRISEVSTLQYSQDYVRKHYAVHRKASLAILAGEARQGEGEVEDVGEDEVARSKGKASSSS